MKYLLILLIFFTSCATTHRYYDGQPIPLEVNKPILASTEYIESRVSWWDVIGLGMLFVAVIVIAENNAKIK